MTDRGRVEPGETSQTRGMIRRETLGAGVGTLVAPLCSRTNFFFATLPPSLRLGPLAHGCPAQPNASRPDVGTQGTFQNKHPRSYTTAGPILKR